MTRRSGRLRRAGGIVAFAVVGVLIGALLLLFGPRTDVACLSESPLERVAVDVLQQFGVGHSDTNGTIPQQCPAPRRMTWVVAALVVVGTAALAVWHTHATPVAAPANLRGNRVAAAE